MSMAPKVQKFDIKRSRYSPAMENWSCDVSEVAPSLSRAVMVRQAVDYFHAAGFHHIHARLKQVHLPWYALAMPAKVVNGGDSHRPDLTAEGHRVKVYFDVVLPEYVYHQHFPDRWQAWANAREFGKAEIWFGVPDNGTAMRVRDRWESRINTGKPPNRILVFGGAN